MEPADLIRAAGKLLDERGWGQGTVGQHAFAADGFPVTLWGNTKSSEPIDTSRAAFNTQAARFSIYGAIVAAHAVDGTPLKQADLMWDCLYHVAREELGEQHVPGGTNYVHPIIAYNNAEGRTKEQVLAFMAKVAKEIETTMAIRVDATGVSA